MSKLKPCPFCGGEADVERAGDSRQSCVVACLECGCRLESNETGYGHFWNTRNDDREKLLKRALKIITDACMHGMPITEEVAAVRNEICGPGNFQLLPD